MAAELQDHEHGDLRPSLAEADAAESALCPECIAPAPCRTRRALDGQV